MYILLKTDKPEHIFMHGKDLKQCHFLYADTLEDAKMYLENLHDTDDEEFWSKYNLTKGTVSYDRFYKYITDLILTTNKLSDDEIEDICREYLYFLGKDNKKKPAIKIIDKRTAIELCQNEINRDEEIYLKYIVNRFTQTRNNLKLLNDINPVNDLNIKLPVGFNSLSYTDSYGILNKNFYKFIYYFDFLKIEIPDERLQRFWNFYKKTLGLYAITYHKRYKKFWVIKKPDEIFIKNEITHCRYGKKYYCDGIEVPQWLYEGNSENIDIEWLASIDNADIRTIFIKKVGINKLIEQGTIIDSYENYPDNEWWIKSEYKLIDMKNILVQKVIVTRQKRENINYKYAPFLCMKNQTTGDYHMEGVSPDCRNLYDALKMRYQLLELPSYEIKNIK